MKSKKAGLFMPIVTISAIVVLTAIAVVLVLKVIKVERNIDDIGKKQFSLIEDVYNNGEKALFFVDQASLYALRQAAYTLGQQGGFGENRGCGINNGYTLWNKENAECYPDSNKAKENLKVELQNEQNKYFARYPEITIPQTNYELELRNKLEVVGKAKTPIKIGSEIAVKETVPEPEPEPGKPGGVTGPEKPGEAPVLPKVSAGSLPQKYFEGVKREECYQNKLAAFPVKGGAKFDNDWGYYNPTWNTVHEGNDLYGAEGTPLVAVSEGTFLKFCNSLGGNIINLITNEGVTYYYAHLSGYAVENNAKVVPGQVIGYMGSTVGCSCEGPGCGIAGRTANHLHFGIYTPDFSKAFNPYCTLTESVDGGRVVS